ncbi:hypothetical protein Fmac_022971 [Flemingia macrophylla]|uniref:C2H2-type domain-containing protein n=1 Tax=Flemingia macrophylla TaxID=520843 RepID=A0ABD1LKR0_9FABA
MKRQREVDSITMANYLMFLSGGGEFHNSNNNKPVFECKTCSRKFQSFQALGGHRASHKKLRLMAEGDNQDQVQINGSTPKPKTHECSICGLEFTIGQALGGHMRRHRASNGNMQTALHSISPNKRVLFPDLNLTPIENDLELFNITQPTPLVHCSN